MENNPLKQYFRRPVIYIRLPSDGRYYEPGVIKFPENGELPVYAMTAIDEMTVRTPDALFNGAAVADLISSCIPNILQPWKINTIDLEAVLVAIRAASNDGKLEISTVCPSCNDDTKYDINLMAMLSQIPDVDYDAPLVIGELKIKFRPLTHLETNKNDISQFEIQRMLANIEQFETDGEKQEHMSAALKKMNEMITGVIADTIEYIETPETQVTEKEFIMDFLTNTDKRSSEAIKNHSIKLKEKSELAPLEIKCASCGHEYKQRVIMNVSDFFA